MKHRSSIYFLIALVAFLVWTMFSYVNIGNNVDDYRKHKSEFVESLSYQNRLLDVNTSINTFLGSDWVIRKEISDVHREKAQVSRDLIQENSVYHGIASVVFIVIILLVYWRTFSLRQSLTISITIVALTFLFFGVTLPIMEISAYQSDFSFGITIPWEIPVYGDQITLTFPGEMYFAYQEKSVFGLLNTLFLAENYFVFGAITVFSVVIPFAKLLYSLSVMLTPRLQEKERLREIMGFVAKWSMADVFVASIFLGYLSMQNINPAIETDTRTMVGIYFFFMFVVFSIISSRMIEWTIRGAEREAPRSVRGMDISRIKESS